jgi:hypothetical protein
VSAPVTVIFGCSSHQDPSGLPGWTLPFLVRIAPSMSLEAANGGPVLTIVSAKRGGRALKKAGRVMRGKAGSG